MKLNEKFGIEAGNSVNFTVLDAKNSDVDG